MKLRICAIGKLKTRHWQTAANDYATRIGHYFDCSTIELRDTLPAGRPDAEIMAADGRRIVERISPGSLVVAMDKSGLQWSTEDLAHFLEQRSLYGPKMLTFCIGGPLGFDSSFLAGADKTLSLSPMTFPHELARVMLLEQLYRACTILRGEKYHKT